MSPTHHRSHKPTICVATCFFIQLPKTSFLFMVYNNLALIVYNLTIKQNLFRKISSVWQKNITHGTQEKLLFIHILIFFFFFFCYFWNGKKVRFFFWCYIVAELSFGITKYLIFFFSFFWVFLVACCFW